MKKNILIVCLIVVVIALAATLAVFIFSNSNMNQPQSQNIKDYDSDFSDITFYDSNEESYSITDIDATYKLVFFMEADCSSCIKMLPQVDRLSRIYDVAGLDVLVLWENDIPRSDVEEYDFSNYSLHNTQISEFYGTAFIIDEENKVEYKESVNMNSLVLKLSDYIECESEEIILSSNEYIKNYYGKGDLSKPLLIFFSMIGCPDCEAADEVVYTEEMQEKYNIIKISMDKNDSIVVEDGYMDDMRLFKSIYSIVWYPSFLLLDETDYKFIGEMGLEELVAEFNDFLQ